MKATWTTDSAVLCAAFDLPGTGELVWETEPVVGERLHDTARARLWLGGSLIGEWAACIAAVGNALHREFPGAALTVVAEREAAFAALVAAALAEEGGFFVEDHGMPDSLENLFSETNHSLAWIVPGFLLWGDIADLRKLAGRRPDSGAAG